MFQALKLIEEHGSMHGDTFVYADGWDDARIASDVGCSETSIAYRRKETFGKLRTKSVAKPEANASAIDDLRARVEVLERTVRALKNQWQATMPTLRDDATATKPNGTQQIPVQTL